MRELLDRRHLLQQERVVGAMLLDRAGAGARGPADLPFHLGNELADAVGDLLGALGLLGHAGGRRVAVRDGDFQRAIHGEHEHDEPDERNDIFAEQPPHAGAKPEQFRFHRLLLGPIIDPGGQQPQEPARSRNRVRKQSVKPDHRMRPLRLSLPDRMTSHRRRECDLSHRTPPATCGRPGWAGPRSYRPSRSRITSRTWFLVSGWPPCPPWRPLPSPRIIWSSDLMTSSTLGRLPL